MQNCDNVRLEMIQPPPVTTKAIGEVCALEPSELKNVTKIMFLVDKSGSNFTGNNGAGSGTDPNKTFRSETILEFVDKYATNTSVEWGFVAFGLDNTQEGRAIAYINEQGDEQQPVFSPDSQRMYDAIERMRADQDTGSTPYYLAIQMAIQAITEDRKKVDLNRTKYLVVMITDGVPTSPQYKNGNDTVQSKIEDHLQALVDMKVPFSTIYYGPPNAVADGIPPYTPQARLERMAEVGKGKFSDVNADGKVPLEKLLIFNIGEPWLIKRFVVNNLNSAPCDDGTMDVDSDSDGLCDKDEEKYNSWLTDPTYRVFGQRMNGKKFDPQNRNSFSEIYSDLFYLKYILFNESLNEYCDPTEDLDDPTNLDEDRDFMNKCEEDFVRATNPQGPTPLWTSKMGETSDYQNFDSDGDGFIDWLELVYSPERSTFPVMDYSSFRREIDKFRMDQIIEQHRNPRAPALTAQPYDGIFRYKGVNSQGQNCYSYDQSVLPLYKTKEFTTEQAKKHPELAHKAGENIVMIYFIQTAQTDHNGAGELRYTFQKMMVGQTQLNLNLKVDGYEAHTASKARVQRQLP